MISRRINIFTGHFGSGKTEVSVNFALNLSETSDNVAIVDFDIVNPYFRTADAKDIMEEKGIKVLLPMYANTNVDVPAIPAEVNTLFENKSYRVILDVGGDDLGAKVLSRYRDEILSDDFYMYFVINTNRPMTDSVLKIEEMIYSIEESARIKVSGLVNNTNLLHFTTSEDVMNGHEMILEVSKKLGIPIAFSTCLGTDSKEIETRTGTSVLSMTKNIKLPWQ
ncbi:MAG TPA: hypothetical protein VF941_08550 [Clostridia bacterium]